MLRPIANILALSLIAINSIQQAAADQEASNVPHVATGEYGQCLAHSIPDNYFEPGGKTHIYAVDKELTLLNTFPWFAQQIYIACNISDGKGIAAPVVVQMGPWPRGHAPNDETLAIAFHFKGEEVARYSTLDIADRDTSNASCSVSHYTVIYEVEGLHRRRDGAVFIVTTVDGRRLSFDAVNGQLMETKRTDPETHRGECYADYPQ